jgi:antibiotic biosynthesis monooxygenase (ABM) superfamily enzyme
MNQQAVIWTVGIQCKAEDETKFNTWYDDIHVPMLLKGGCVQTVTRFKLADEVYHVGITTQVCPNYLTIYEFENQDKFEAWMSSPARAEAGDDKTKTWGENVYEVKWATRYNLINAWNPT